MRISDWSSDVCSSDLFGPRGECAGRRRRISGPVDRARTALPRAHEHSTFTPRDLSARLAHAGLHVPEPAIWTSALATADFLSAQQPQGSAYAIGEVGRTTALYAAGYPYRHGARLCRA